MTVREGNKSKNETHERIIFSANFACPVSGFTIDEIEPRLFSFNNPSGACPDCDGLGTELRFDPDLVVPDDDAQPAARAPSYPGRKTGSTSPYYEQTLEALAKHFKVSMTTPWDEAAREGAATPSSTAPARRRSTSSTTTACAPTRPPSRSRA